MFLCHRVPFVMADLEPGCGNDRGEAATLRDPEPAPRHQKRQLPSDAVQLVRAQSGEGLRRGGRQVSADY